MTESVDRKILELKSKLDESQKQLVLFFSHLPRLRFITIKHMANDPKKMKISYWSDRLRKISSNFYIIAEENKVSKGEHYHALVSVDVGIPKSWFHKGTHFLDKPVGNKNKTEGLPNYEMIGSNEEYEQVVHGGEIPLDMTEQELDVMFYKLKLRQRQKKSNDRKEWHIGSVLTYLNKELEIPRQYVNYMLIKNKKNHVLF